MKHYRLKGTSQLARQGFTDLFVVAMTDSDIQAITTDDLLCNVPLVVLNLGDTILDQTRIQIVEALDPAPSANAIVTASVGRTGASYVDCIAAFTLMNATATALHTSATAAAGIGHQTIAANSTQVYCQIDINDADGALTDLTAGIIHIAMAIIRASEQYRNEA